MYVPPMTDQASRVVGRERAKLILEWYTCFDKLFEMLPENKKTHPGGMTPEERALYDHSGEIYIKLYGSPNQVLFTNDQSDFLGDIEIPDESRGCWVSTRF